MSKKIRIIVIVCFLAILVFLMKDLFSQKFTSVEDLQNYIKGFGIAAPLVLTLFQAFQVVVPVLPGYLGCAAGAIAFGPFVGFLCNYIGISLGSIIAFFLAIPTTNVRPNIVGNGIWENAMIWLYKIDPANNLFPSIHFLTSWLC